MRRNKKKNRLVALVCEKKLLGTILIIRSDLAIVCFINRLHDLVLGFYGRVCACPRRRVTFAFFVLVLFFLL